MGLLTSWLLVKDTRHHVATETSISKVRALKNVFWETTWKDKNLGSVTQAGLINNLNDGMAWGIFPILLASKGFSLDKIGIITAIYPAVWGFGQLFTGKMADIYSKKKLLFAGMLLQGIASSFFLLPVRSCIMYYCRLYWGGAQQWFIQPF